MPFTHRTDASSTTDASSYNVTVTGVTGGGCLWVTVHSAGLSAAAPTPTLSMTGATFGLAESVGSLPNNSRVSVFYAQTYNAGASQTLTISFGADTQTNLIWSVEEQSNPGAGAPVLRSASIFNSTPANTHTVALSPGAGEQFMVAWIVGGALISPPSTSGAIELMDRTASSPNTQLETNWNPVCGNPVVTNPSTAVQSAVIALAASVGSPNGFVHRAGAWDATDASSYNVTIPYLAGGGVMWVAATSQASSAPATPTLSMTGATFTLARSEAVGTDRVSVWWSQDYDTGTNQILGFATGAVLGLHWSVEEQIPGRTSGNPVVQHNYVAGSTPLATTLAAGDGAMFGTVSMISAATATPNSGSKLYEFTGSSPTNSFTTYWSQTVNTAPSVAVSTGVTNGLIVLEAVSEVAQARVAWVQMEVPDVPVDTVAEVAWAQMEVPNAAVTPQARVAWAQMEVPSPLLPGSAQVAYAQLEVPNAPIPPAPWDPAAECETLEWRNPAGETLRFRTLIGTVGRFMPPIGVTTIPTPAGHGSHYLGAAHLARPVAVPVAVPGPLDGRAELRRWAQVLDPSVGEGTLTVVEGTWAGRRLRCVYEAGLDEWGELNRRVNQGTLIFRAAWPYWEDSNEFTTEVDQDDTQHTWFPFLPLILGASDAWAVFTVDNTGDVAAWPVITVHGPAEEVTVTNETTGAFWQVSGTNILPGSLLTVDHRPGHKTVEVDGVNNFDRLTPSSSLWPLVRGVNQVSVGAAITDLDTLVSFTWRRNWLAA